MKRITAVLLLVVALPSAAAQWTSRIDLTRVLNDPALLHRLTVFYTTPERPGQILYIHGDGTLLLQQLPIQPGVWNSLVPTCTAGVSEDSIRGLVALFVKNRFFDLPRKNFIFVYVSQDPVKDVHIHTIMIDTGQERAARSFATGTYAGQVQTIPPGFAEIETAIQRIRDDAFPPSKRCTFAAPLKF